MYSSTAKTIFSSLLFLHLFHNRCSGLPVPSLPSWSPKNYLLLNVQYVYSHTCGNPSHPKCRLLRVRPLKNLLVLYFRGSSPSPNFKSFYVSFRSASTNTNLLFYYVCQTSLPDDSITATHIVGHSIDRIVRGGFTKHNAGQSKNNQSFRGCHRVFFFLNLMPLIFVKSTRPTLLLSRTYIEPTSRSYE